MFSGLIEAVGVIDRTEKTTGGLRLHVSTSLASDLVVGDSIAANGVCLTVVSRDDACFVAEVSPETMRVSTLGGLLAEAKVNLERPLRADMRFGGHFVLGHVDGVGRLVAIRQQSEFFLVTVAYDPNLDVYLVHKGSVAVDGISLTVAALGSNEFDVQIVPYTWEHTNLHALSVETAVNLECDIIGKYVVKAVRDTGR